MRRPRRRARWSGSTRSAAGRGRAGGGPPPGGPPGWRGGSAAELPRTAVPFGTYGVQLEAGGRVVESSWVTVDVIRKPDFELGIETDRHVLISGTALRATVTARFYEGTGAPGVALSVGPLDEAQTATTESDGTAA